MKKFLALLLAVICCLSIVACASKKEEPSKLDIIRAYVETNGDEIVQGMEESFATSSGMTCTSSIDVINNGIVIDININELDELDDTVKQTMQDAYDALDSTFDGMLLDMQKEIPEVEHLTINVCEKDGDLIAKIVAD